MNEYFDYGVYEDLRSVHSTKFTDFDRSLITKFEQLFLDIKQDPKFLRANVGQIYVPNIVDFKTNKSNFKVFRKEIIQQSGLIVLLVDVSGSMSWNDKIEKAKKLVANLMKSVESNSKIELRVFTYSGSSDFDSENNCNRDLLIMQEIKDPKYVHLMRAGGSSPTDKAIHYVTQKFEESRKNKTLIVLTDGSPNSNHSYGSHQKSLLETKKVLVKAESNKFNIFGCGFNVSISLDKIMENSFRGNYINLQNEKDIEKYLFVALSDFVRSIKNV